jgi:hypothetical protein
VSFAASIFPVKLFILYRVLSFCRFKFDMEKMTKALLDLQTFFINYAMSQISSGSTISFEISPYHVTQIHTSHPTPPHLTPPPPPPHTPPPPTPLDCLVLSYGGLNNLVGSEGGAGVDGSVGVCKCGKVTGSCDTCHNVQVVPTIHLKKMIGVVKNWECTSCPVSRCDFTEDDVIGILPCGHYASYKPMKEWYGKNSHTCFICSEQF